MIDFFASITIALIVIMTIVIFLSNQRQAQILKQMRFVIEDWYQAQMRDRRKAFKQEIKMQDVLKWVGSQVNLTVIEQGRRLENPQALEFLTTEGVRLIVSPLRKSKLRLAARKIESKRRKVANLVEPLLGSKPRKIQVVERSNHTVHEWFEVEIEAALEKLGVNWGKLDTLYFYMIPVQPAEQHVPLISIEPGHFKKIFTDVVTWLKQRVPKVSG
jgi:hypothetical protein